MQNYDKNIKYKLHILRNGTKNNMLKIKRKKMALNETTLLCYKV